MIFDITRDKNRNNRSRPVLQPKRPKPVVEIAHRLKALGYDVIPLVSGKDKPFKGWPRMPNDPAAIGGWYGRSAAVRLKGSKLFVIDLDIRIAVVRDAIVAELERRWPAFMANCLRRHSGAVTLALIGQVSTAKRNKKTRRFVGDGTDPRGDMVELFMGNTDRYLGVWGQHSEGRTYEFIGRSILDVAADTLPWFPDSDIFALLDCAETVMAAHGLTMINKDARPAARVVYDLEPDQIFELSDGRTLTLAELEDEARVGPIARHGVTERLAGYATLWEPSTTRDRVLVNMSATGLALWDTKTEVSHRWKHRAPPEHLTELLAELKALRAKRQEARP